MAGATNCPTSVDLTGRTHEHRDLAGFLDLAAERGLRSSPGPGPFVMAELKNEGIPFRLYRDHPEVRPVGWDGEPAPTRDARLPRAGLPRRGRRWYGEVMPVLAERLVTRGGPVVAVQLDNEVGMLSWVTNTPDLTDRSLDDFAAWAVGRCGKEALTDGTAPTRDADAWAARWRSGDRRRTGSAGDAPPRPRRATTRDRYADYVASGCATCAERTASTACRS